jgi:hypothetical protein
MTGINVGVDEKAAGQAVSMYPISLHLQRWLTENVDCSSQPGGKGRSSESDYVDVEGTFLRRGSWSINLSDSNAKHR